MVPVGLSAGLDPTAVAFLSTAAAGYCITLPASAKPVALFSRLEGAYAPADLRHLSTRLLPAHHDDGHTPGCPAAGLTRCRARRRGRQTDDRSLGDGHRGDRETGRERHDDLVAPPTRPAVRSD